MSSNNYITIQEIQGNGLLLEHIKDPTNEICLEAIKKTRGNAKQYSMQYVEEKNQTFEICLEALKQEMQYSTE